MLRAARIADLVDGQSTSSDAKSSKPDPDIVEAAVTRSRFGRDEFAMLPKTPF